jgi:uncharacterized protein (TIGR04255 family)
MSENDSIDRTLTRNAINNFILRIDLIKTDRLEIPHIAAEMSKYFDRTEKRQISNVAINFTKGSSEVTQKESFDYVLSSETKPISITFSEIQNAFWLASNQYKDNSAYKEMMDITINSVKSTCGDVESRRIGLRYINEFKCERQTSINAIYGKRLASLLKSMLVDPSQSRVIGMEEYNKDAYKVRLQYGIPNKFYPSIITIYDLLLDIDSFVENTNTIGEWNDVIRTLNHAAYDMFSKEINPKYLEELK